MSFSLFNKNKKNKAGTGRLQVGIIEDSDDDDFLEPLVMVKKKKARKLSGNDLLCISSQKVTPSTLHLDKNTSSSSDNQEFQENGSPNASLSMSSRSYNSEKKNLLFKKKGRLRHDKTSLHQYHYRISRVAYYYKLTHMFMYSIYYNHTTDSFFFLILTHILM